MRKVMLFISSALLIGVVYSVSAQRAVKHTAANKKDTASSSKMPVIPVVDVYLGNTGLTGGAISKGQFDAAAKQGLILSGKEAGGVIKSFTFMYAERGLFEDSVGNPLILTDYLTEICDGAQLSAGVQSSIYERTKPGDTAYFNDIRIRLSSGFSARGKVMKFVITK